LTVERSAHRKQSIIEQGAYNKAWQNKNQEDSGVRRQDDATIVKKPGHFAQDCHFRKQVEGKCIDIEQRPRRQ